MGGDTCHRGAHEVNKRSTPIAPMREPISPILVLSTEGEPQLPLIFAGIFPDCALNLKFRIKVNQHRSFFSIFFLLSLKPF